MDRVTICEMSPRDGVQSLGGTTTPPTLVPTASKIKLIDALAAAAFPFIEATAFVNPKVMPQMADAEDVGQLVTPRAGVQLAALVPNRKHYERCRPSHFDTVSLFVSASEEYSQKNMGVPLGVALGWATEIAVAAKADGRRLRAHVSGAFQDVFSSAPVDLPALVRVIHALLDAGCETIALADTNGETSPRRIREVLRDLASEINVERLGVHLHDRGGIALANALAALDVGIRTLDASVGGIGGSSKAVSGGRPTAGNIATEELVELCEGLGLSTGIDREKLVEAGRIVYEITHAAQDGAPPSRLLREQLGYRLAWVR